MDFLQYHVSQKQVIELFTSSSILYVSLLFSTLDHNQIGFKTKIKWTTSEPLQNKKFNRTDKGDVAHLGSENVVLKGYQALTENGTLPRPPQRERSGSDPTTEVHLQPLKSHNTAEVFRYLLFITIYLLLRIFQLMFILFLGKKQQIYITSCLEVIIT